MTSPPPGPRPGSPHGVRFAPRTRVAVVGAGVVGLSVAHDLAVAGLSVVMVADLPALDGVSGVAGGLWFPYGVATAPGADDVLLRSRARFEHLAGVAGVPVAVREGTVVERTADADRSWTAAAIRPREARADELPPDALGGVQAALPVADTPLYLRWLQSRCEELGVDEVRQEVHDIDEVVRSIGAGAVVVAAGGRSGALLDDPDSGYPVAGQVVRVRNPGLTDWLLDEDHPGGVTYVIPRGADVVCGGTAVVGATGTAVDPDV